MAAAVASLLWFFFALCESAQRAGSIGKRMREVVRSTIGLDLYKTDIDSLCNALFITIIAKRNLQNE